MESVLDRFLRYVKIHTTSCDDVDEIPSTSRQKDFALILAEELKDIGMVDVEVDEHAYVMATLPSNINKDIPVIGFIAHMDTSPDFSGENVNPQIIRNYSGGTITLNEKDHIKLDPSDFPELKKYTGQDLITTDGSTLLGADDKAGIAEIITAMDYLINHPEIKHGKIRICFTPDEEVGKGADLFNVSKFGATCAYTLDGGEIGELEYENFNAAMAAITIYGRNVHPGYAKNKMVNSMSIGAEFVNLLPTDEVPEKTEGYDGFYHLISMEGDVEKTSLKYIIRDFDDLNFGKRKSNVESIAEKLKSKYPDSKIELLIKDQYFNMRQQIEPVMHVVEIAKQAMLLCDVDPMIKPIRGGTDGARLSFMGLPTPNIFAGGHNFHGRFEFVPIQSMEKAVSIIVKISELFAQK